jgi:hypothetical protein
VTGRTEVDQSLFDLTSVRDRGDQIAVDAIREVLSRGGIPPLENKVILASIESNNLGADDASRKINDSYEAVRLAVAFGPS